MDNLQFLFAGFAVFWAGILVYLLALQGRVRSLEREIARLEERLSDHGAAAAVEGASAPSSPSSTAGRQRGPEQSSSPT